MTYQLAFGYGSYVATETLTAANPYGTWTMNVKADDYCGVTSSASGEFSTGPNTYDFHVSLSGLPANMSSWLWVDGASRGKISGTETRTLSFPIGTQHVVGVDQYVYGGMNGTRYFAEQNKTTVAGAGSHVFPYQLQYLLTERIGIGYSNRQVCWSPSLCNVTTVDWSAFTTTAGYPLDTRIWYPAGTIVTLGQPVPSVSTRNGTRFWQDGWDINCNIATISKCESGNSLPPSIIMNGPHTVTTLYDLQYRLWLVSYYGNPQLQVPAGASLVYNTVTQQFTTTVIQPYTTATQPYTTITQNLWTTVYTTPYTTVYTSVSYATEVTPTSGPPNNFTVNQASNPTVVSSWYNAGTMAFASVTSPVGFGIQYVFAFWEPNSTLVTSPTSPTTGVIMKKPMVLTAIWTASYTLLYAEVAGGIGVIAVIAVAAKYLGLGGLHLRKPPAGGPGPVEEPVEEF
jgi:hypothetical protein